jgi:serine/threonine protein kinase
LRRDVAIKVLPEAFAADPDRVARFEREAELLASLNHPRIADGFLMIRRKNPLAPTATNVVFNWPSALGTE